MKKLIAIVIIVTMIMSFAQSEAKTNYSGTWISSLAGNGVKGMEILEINPSNEDGYTTMYHFFMWWSSDGELFVNEMLEGVWYPDGYGYIFNDNGTVKRWIGATGEVDECGYTIFVIRDETGNIGEYGYKYVSTMTEDYGL